MATPTVSLELDPIFLKALRLLHSKAKDSAEQLKQMLDDVLHHRPISSGLGSNSSSGQRDYVKPSIPPTKVSIKQEAGTKLILTTSKKTSPKHLSDVAPSLKKSSSLRDDDTKKTEKRTFDKVIKQEIIEPAGPDSKRTKLESPKPSPSPSPPPVLKIEIKKETEDFSTDDWNTDADDFAMEMGLACVICRNIEVSSGNQLVECQECHNLYHQECHRPSITDQDVNDPRVVWYCAKCAKNIKKLTIKTQKTGKTLQPTIVKEPMIPTKTIKVEPPAPSLSATHLFKRAEIKSTLTSSSSGSSSRSSSSSSGNKPTGLAGLAASLTGKSSSLAKGTSQLGNHGGKQLSVTKSSTVLPNLTKAATSSVGATPSPTIATQATKGSGPFAALTSSIKAPTPSGSTTSSGVTALSSKQTSGASSGSSSSKTASSGNGGNGNGSSSKLAGSSSLMSADKRLQIMKKKAEKKKQEKRWSSK